jgi:hypothetical protein
VNWNATYEHNHENVNRKIKQHCSVEPKKPLFFDMNKFLQVQQLVKIDQRKNDKSNTGSGICPGFSKDVAAIIKRNQTSYDRQYNRKSAHPCINKHLVIDNAKEKDVYNNKGTYYGHIIPGKQPLQ